MSYLVKPIDVLEHTGMDTEVISRLKEYGILNVDTLYARIMTISYSERESDMKSLESLIGLQEGFLFSFAKFLEKNLVSRPTLDKYEANGYTFECLEKELKWLDLEKDYKLDEE